MKKFISLFLAILLAFSAVACSGGAGEATTVADDPTEAPATDPATEPAPETTEEIKEDKTLNILFLGNSLMYYNDMPDILFPLIAQANGKKVNVKSVTKGSATISDFADERTEVGKQAIPLLKNQSWDYVIIEPSRRISPYENTVKEAELASAKKIQELAKAAGGDVILYSVWGNNNGNVVEYKAQNPTSMVEVATHLMGRKPHTKFMHEVNLEFAAALGVKVALAGHAFENCIAKYPDLNLYHSDERHPSPIGSYLAAAVIYATVFGEKVERIPYTISAAPAAGVLEGIVNDTIFGGLVPDLTEDVADKPFNLLIVGSNLMDDYSCASVFGKLVKEADGRTVVSQYVRSSTFVINDLVNANNDLGLRAALADNEWDAIIIQISRRCTKSATDVEESELNALRTVMPLFKAETDKIYIFTLNSKSKPGIFTTAGGDPGYTDSGKKETYSAAEGSAYFKALADKWAAEFGVGVINYGEAYHDYPNPEKIGLGYLQAAMIYNAVFDKDLPETVETNGNSAATAKTLREIAKKFTAN